VRLRFTKAGKIRFTSHRDVARMWERALRRVQLPVAYSEGFSPRPKVHFGLALSTGYESLGEYLDIDLLTDPGSLDVAALPARLTPALPQGIEVEAAAEVPAGTTSLQSAVTSCSWRLEVLGDEAPAVDAAVARALGATELPATRVRKGQEVTDDLRPYVLALAVVDGLTPGSTPASTSGAVLAAELGTQPRSLRPSRR
jgi:radical SAM-linked protein